MVNATPVKEEILREIDHLPLHFQKRVLDFVRTLKSTPDEGVPGRELLCFAGILPLAEGKLMIRAIEESCEQVDPNEW
jgi:hypothetical protein